MDVDPLPALLWLAVAALIIRIGHSGEFAPAMLTMCVIAFWRHALWFSDHMAWQNQVALMYPWVQLLASEECIRKSGYVMNEAVRVVRYWASMSAGIVIGCIAWALYPGKTLSIRVSVQVAAFCTLVIASAFTWRYRASVPILGTATTRHNLLAAMMLGSILSSRPSEKDWTIATEVIHLAVFVAFYGTFRPSSPRSSASSAA